MAGDPDVGEIRVVLPVRALIGVIATESALRAAAETSGVPAARFGACAAGAYVTGASFVIRSSRRCWRRLPVLRSIVPFATFNRYGSWSKSDARAILRDFAAEGSHVFCRFKPGMAGTLWYYACLLNVYRHKATSGLLSTPY